MTTEHEHEWISAFLDGELTAAKQTAAAQDLTAGSEEQRLHADLAMLSQLLRSLPIEPAPPELADAIRREVAAAGAAVSAPATVDSQRPSSRRSRRVLGSGMVLLLLAGIGLTYWSSQSITQHGETAPVWEMAQRESASGNRGGNFDSLSGEPALREEIAGNPGPMSLLLSDSSAAGDSENADDKSRRSLGETQSHPSAPMAAAAVPPLPELSDMSRASLLARLEASPKLKGRLRPGELVQMITSSGDQVTVVELSVVDVSRSLGDLQVLLARHEIHPPGTSEPHGEESREIDRFHDFAADGVSQDPASELQAKSGATPLSAGPLSPADSSPAVAASQSPAPGRSAADLMAVYVEASDSQFLRSLEQLVDLPSVRSIQVGDAGQLTSSTYSVIPYATSPGFDKTEVDKGLSDTVAKSQSLPADPNFAFLSMPEMDLAQRSNEAFVLERVQAENTDVRWRQSRGAIARDLAASERETEPDRPHELELREKVRPEAPAAAEPGSGRTSGMEENLAMRQQNLGVTSHESDWAVSEIPMDSYQVPVRVMPLQELADRKVLDGSTPDGRSRLESARSPVPNAAPKKMSAVPTDDSDLDSLVPANEPGDPFQNPERAASRTAVGQIGVGDSRPKVRVLIVLSPVPAS